MNMHNMIRVFALLLASTLLAPYTPAKAQSQKQKMINNLLTQIGLFQTFMGKARKGYKIVGDGIHLIKDIKHGEFSLHQHYFNSLEMVNPQIRKYAKVTAIIRYEYEILQMQRKTTRFVNGSRLYSAGEIIYINQVFDRLLEQTSRNMEELAIIVKDGEVKMSDDERIRRIDQLYLSVQNDQRFSQHFATNVRGLGLNRTVSHAELQRLKELYKN